MRLCPGRPLPPYAFVPGASPHPVRDPAGHSAGVDPAWGAPPDPAAFSQDPRWLYALDLFDAGFYWEAHEPLEHWWAQVAPGDPRRAFFQGLLRLAAAGVKARVGHPPGVASHAHKAAALLREVEVGLPPGGRLLGLPVGVLVRAADDLALVAHQFVRRDPPPPVEAILPIRLTPLFRS